MKTFKQMCLTVVPVLLLTGMNACEESDDAPVIDVVFTLEIEGNQVSFQNQTQGADSYQWDFGDSTSSEETSPVHTYPGKGKYVATLYATTASGETVEGSTVIRIAKSTPVKLDDHSLADWDEVTDHVITPAGSGNAIQEVKLDYDGNAVYIYLEMQGQRSDGPIFDFYLDTDHDSGTGYLTGNFPDGGYDVLMEGQILNDWFDVFYHTGDQASFSFEQQSISGAHQVGAVVEEDGLLKFECSLSRSKLKNLTGSGLRIGIEAVKSDWSASFGSAPDAGSAGYFLNMDE